MHAYDDLKEQHDIGGHLCFTKMNAIRHCICKEVYHLNKDAFPWSYVKCIWHYFYHTSCTAELRFSVLVKSALS